eukprot:5731449-Pleurochrysis_carterae.AAC.1
MCSQFFRFAALRKRPVGVVIHGEVPFRGYKRYPYASRPTGTTLSPTVLQKKRAVRVESRHAK